MCSPEYQLLTNYSTLLEFGIGDHLKIGRCSRTPTNRSEMSVPESHSAEVIIAWTFFISYAFWLLLAAAECVRALELEFLWQKKYQWWPGQWPT